MEDFNGRRVLNVRTISINTQGKILIYPTGWRVQRIQHMIVRYRVFTHVYQHQSPFVPIGFLAFLKTCGVFHMQLCSLRQFRRLRMHYSMRRAR